MRQALLCHAVIVLEIVVRNPMSNLLSLLLEGFCSLLDQFGGLSVCRQLWHDGEKEEQNTSHHLKHGLPRHYVLHPVEP